MASAARMSAILMRRARDREEAYRLKREAVAREREAAARELSLYDAIRNQDEARVARLLRVADLNWQLTEAVTEEAVPRWSTFLSLSCSLANREITKLLIRAQADVECREPSPLVACCNAGFADGVSWLIAAGATCTDEIFAEVCARFCNDPSYVACVDTLVIAGEANVNAVSNQIGSQLPLIFHALAGMPYGNADDSTALVKLLASFGASREPGTHGHPYDTTTGYPRQAEDFVMDGYLLVMDGGIGHQRPDLRDWLIRSRHWTPLHYLEVVSPQRARKLLCTGQPILSSRAPQPSDGEPTPSPFELAQLAAAAGEAPAGSTARLVLTYHNLRRWRNLALFAGRMLAMRIRASERLYTPGGKGYDLCRTNFESKRRCIA